MKKTYEGLLYSLSDDQTEIKLEGTISEINKHLKHNIQIAN